MTMAKSKFHAGKESSGGILGTLSQSLPDERPITAVAVVENTGRCPSGYYPVLKTYDEDSDADLWRQQAIFGRRTCRYICISKSERGTRLTGVRVAGVAEPPPEEYTVTVATTADTDKPAWRRRRLCFATRPLDSCYLTDIIVCSRLKKAPAGFSLAGEINGMTICYKTGGGGGAPADSSKSPHNYENVLYKNPTPECKRPPPERPPKVSALVAELNKLNLQTDSNVNNENGNRIDTAQFGTNHDYEILNTSYNLQPSRPAPPVPPASLVGVGCTSYSSHTLGSWNPLEGVAFALNPKLSANFNFHMSQMPSIKKRTLIELNQRYHYSFLTERQT